MTVTSDNIQHQLDSNKKWKLIDMLLKCPIVKNKDNRDALLGEMPPDITAAIHSSDHAKVHVTNIVNACMDHASGFEHLMEALRFFDGNTKQFKELEEFINESGCQEMETPPHDNENISKGAAVQVAVQKERPHDISPFIMGLPVFGRRFFGREEILESLFDLWKAFPDMPIQNAAIWGEKKIGKTSLLLHLKDIAMAGGSSEAFRKGQKTDWLLNSKSYSWIFVDFRDPTICSKKKFLEYLLKSMKLDKTDDMDLSLSDDNPLFEFSMIVSQHLKNPTIILLDEIDSAFKHQPAELDNNFWDGMRALCTTMLEPQCLGFVLASCRHPMELSELSNGAASPFFNIFGYDVELTPFTEQEARELISTSPKPFSEGDIQFILEKSEYKPLLLQILCNACMNHLIKGKNDIAWQKKAEKKIRAYKRKNTRHQTGDHDE